MTDTSRAIASKSCATCAKPASKRCVTCAEGLDAHGEPSLTYYCGKECQRAHWPTHKAECKAANARKNLYRVGDVLGSAFQRIRYTAWSTRIVRVERVKGEQMHVFEDEPAEADLLVPFPSKMFREEEVAGVLTHGACFAAFRTMFLLLSFGLAIGGSRIEAVVLSPKTKHLARFHKPDGTLRPVEKHYVWRVHMAGHLYAIDVAGAQFGLARAVMPWSHYEAGVADEIHQVVSSAFAVPKLESQREEYIKTFDADAALSHTQTSLCVEQGIHGVIRNVCREYVQKPSGDTEADWAARFLACKPDAQSLLRLLLESPQAKHEELKKRFVDLAIEANLRTFLSAVESNLQGYVKEIVAEVRELPSLEDVRALSNAALSAS